MRGILEAASLSIMLVAFGITTTVPADAQVPTRRAPATPEPRDTPGIDPPPDTGGSTEAPTTGAQDDGGGTQTTGRRRGDYSGGDARTRSGPGSSGWHLCNRSGQARIHAVAVWQDGTGWRSTGWLPIASNTCLSVSPPASTVYYFAAGRGKSWSGRTPFCLSAKTARAYPAGNCGAGEQLVGFRRTGLTGGLVTSNFR